MRAPGCPSQPAAEPPGAGPRVRLLLAPEPRGPGVAPPRSDRGGVGPPPPQLSPCPPPPPPPSPSPLLASRAASRVLFRSRGLLPCPARPQRAIHLMPFEPGGVSFWTPVVCRPSAGMRIIPRPLALVPCSWRSPLPRHRSVGRKWLRAQATGFACRRPETRSFRDDCIRF